jgi:1-deoxy-D-xylulose-5-phosphate synthase
MKQEGSASILERISAPQQVQSLSHTEMEQLASELRREIISTVSATGGHLAPSLGTVELTLALLHTFDPGRNRILWDVGHQSYAYKILTRGTERFRTLRQLGGISGFPRPSESPYDHFIAGHSGNSISSALGMAVARDLGREDEHILSVIGDGSMTAGMAFEGLNQAGGLERNMVVILNDNEMSISQNVGALSSFLSRNLSHHRFLRFRQDLKNWLQNVPVIGDDLLNYAKRSEESLKSCFTPGMLFEAFKFNYLGPIDGHNVRQLTRILEQIRNMDGPILLHIQTTKGKGYEPAEDDPTHFHGVGCFEPSTGDALKSHAQRPMSFSQVMGRTLSSLAETDPRLVAITAAMPEATGLEDFRLKQPERFFDVGICEQHAVTFAAGLASRGYRPAVCIYSTFLQRSYDQIVHDVCLQNLPVTFCMDRAGLVGADGPTHHGAFDLSYLRHIPNMTLMAPKDEAELQRMLATCLTLPGPAAVRYPRGCGTGAELAQSPTPLEACTGQLLRDGSDVCVLALGNTVQPALEAAQELEAESGGSCAVYNTRFVKPLPEEIADIAARFPRLLLVEENALAGGFGSAVLELLADRDLLGDTKIRRMGLPDRFVEHGSPEELRHQVGLDREGIARSLRELLGKE